MSANEPGVLFQPGEMPVGPRPKDRDPRVVKAAIDRLIPKVERWMGDDWREAERVEIVKQVTEACQAAWDGDGYQIARRLDRDHGWECDAELVDILEMYASYCSDIHDQLIRQWVADSGVKPKLALGAEVTMTLPVKGVATGKIVKINTERGEYGVTCPSLGQAWDDKSQMGSCYIVAWKWLENEVARAAVRERLDPDVGEPGASITCPRCKAVSHNPNDVEQRYCGACKHFYADVCAGCHHPFEDHRPVCVHYFLESGRVDPICNCREFQG